MSRCSWAIGILCIGFLTAGAVHAQDAPALKTRGSVPELWTRFSVLTIQQNVGMSMACVEVEADGSYLLESHRPSIHGMANGEFYRASLTSQQIEELHEIIDSADFMAMPVSQKGAVAIRDDDGLSISISRKSGVQEGYVGPPLPAPARSLVRFTKALVKSRQKEKGYKTSDKRLCPRTP